MQRVKAGTVASLWTGNLFVGLLSIALLVEALFNNFGQLNRPGPGMWPAIGAALAIGANILSLIRDANKEIKVPSGGIKRVLLVSFFLASFPFAVQHVGFIVPSVLLIFVSTKVVGRQKFLVSIISATAAPVILFFVFSELLGVRMAWI